MKAATEQFNEIAKSSNGRYYAKYIIDGIERFDILNNLVLENIINANNDIGIGNTCASSVSFLLSKPDIHLENKEITLFQGVKIDNDIDYVQLGIFKIHRETGDGENEKYVGYDRMYSRMENAYFSNLSFPTTDEAIVNEICSQADIRFSTKLAKTHVISSYIGGYSRREMIGYMAALQGSNAVINANGELEFKWYTQTDYKIDGHRYYQGGVTFNTSKNFTVEKLSCSVQNSSDNSKIVLTSGSGLTGINFENPFMTQSILDEVFGKIGGFTYRPLDVKFIGDFVIDVGDIITVTKCGVDYIVPVMQIRHECDGGLISNIKSVGQSESTNSNAMSGPLSKQMERYYAELVLVNKAMVNKLTMDEGDARYFRADEMEVVKADIEEAVIGKLDTTFLTAQNAKLLYASIKDFNAYKGVVDELKVGMEDVNTLIFGSATGNTIQTAFSNSVIAQLGEAQIKSAMIDEIDAKKIVGLDINTTKLSVHSQDGKSVWQDNTIQISDGTRVRVQIGKDARADYNMYVWDKSGNLMVDALGLTKDAIKRKIIRDEMITEDANISAEKINIESLFSVINSDSSHTLKASKIYVDADNQTLDVSFKNVTTSLMSMNKNMETQATKLGVIQGQIESKIWQQDITSAVESIEVGGRNLFKNSNSIALTGSDKPAVTTRTLGKIEVISDSTFNAYTFVQGYMTISPSEIQQSAGDEYTFSCEVRTTNLTKSGLAITYDLRTTAASDNMVKTLGYILPNKNGEWQKISASFKTTDIPHTMSLIAITTYNGIGGFNGVVLEYRNFKLEKGNKATDWTPAPEDVENDLSVLNTKYSDVKQTVDGISTTVGNHAAQIGLLGTKVESSETNYTQLSNKFSWIVKSGSNASDFTITDRMATLAANYINLKGLVAFSGLDTATKEKITAADNWRYSANKTYIDGSKIYTGTITADKLNVTDLSSLKATIANWQIGQTAITKTLNTFIPPTSTEIEEIRQYMLGNASLSSDEREKYDFNCNNKIDAYDLIYARRQQLGISDVNELISLGYEPQYTPLTVSVDYSDVRKIIRTVGKNSWGTEIDNYFGVLGLKCNNVVAENIRIGTSILSSIEIVDSYLEDDSGYIKFYDGTLICTQRIVFDDLDINTEWGSMYESAELDLGQYKETFIEVPKVTLSIGAGSNAGAFIEGLWNAGTSSVGKTYLCRPTSYSSGTYVIQVLAIGRWKD